jgi:phage RecT family recombinase
MGSKVPAIVEKTDKTKAFLGSFKPLISDYATREYNHNAWLKTVMMCIMENDDLVKAMGTPAGQASLYHALRYAASTGLSLNPQEGKAALIAYSGKVQYQVMKGGMIELAMASGKVEFITSDVVYKKDEFEIEKTMNGDTFKFRPALAERGNVIGYFAALKMKVGTVLVKWIDIANMEAHRDRYGKGVDRAGSAWKTSFDGMALKTVLKALLRSVEISPDLTTAVVTDDKFEAGDTGEVIDVIPEPEGGASAEEVKAELEAAEGEGQGKEEPGEQGEEDKDLF